MSFSALTGLGIPSQKATFKAEPGAVVLRRGCRKLWRIGSSEPKRQCREIRLTGRPDSNSNRRAASTLSRSTARPGGGRCGTRNDDLILSDRKMFPSAAADIHGKATA